MKEIDKIKSSSDAQNAAPHLQQSAGEAMKGPATALRFLIIVIGSILVAEILVMFFLAFLPPLSPNLVAFLDAFLLAVVTFPVLYLALFRPLVRQITETQRVEGRLRKAHELSEAIIKTIPFGMDVVDEEGRIVYLSEKLKAVLGNDAIGKTCPAVYREGRETCEDCPVKQGIHVGETRSVEVEGILGGKTFLITYTGMMQDNKKVFLRILEDITERSRAEDELRESEEKYATLVENSLTGIYIDQDGKIVFANHRFAEIYWYPREDLIGIENWRLVHPEDRPLLNQIRLKRLAGEEAPLEYEARGLTKDGDTIWINRRNTRIEYKGRPAILGNTVDITEQKQAEEQLRKINEELKNFIHMVSHDLKTPIISIQGFAARLLKNYQEKLGDKGRNYLERIKSSACRMEMLISDLLALSKIGRVASTFEDVSALEIVKEVISNLQYRIKENGIEVVLPPGLPVIYADQARLYQVFENLLVNAIKYMGNTKNPRIDIGCEDRENFHRFYIRDNGSGIAPQYHRKIFEMFYRLKETRAEDGTGLGLAIVDRIARNHGGKVWVESEKGKGAVFYFNLPKKKMESDLSRNCHSKSP
ncbi:MAG: PAS domain S-box protein [Deltaproteobacteria bacterium]|nr:MAG: PAS domain S-box protein [Deltaproteobacteria bacterium]